MIIYESWEYLSMKKYVKWRDRSFRTTHKAESWVPEAMIDLVEGSKAFSQQLLLPEKDAERIKRGEILCSNREQAKNVAYEMVKRHAWNEWRIPEEQIQEY
jgi:hypothetical protein